MSAAVVHPPQRLRRVWSGVFALGVCALAAALAIPAAAQQAGSESVRARNVYEDLQMFSQVYNQIRVNHPDSIDTHELFMAAVEGMVRAADPHSYVLPALRLAPEKERAFREGKLIPVPIRFSFVGGAPVVVSVAPSSSAARLGILPGDELIAVDDAPITARAPEELDITLAGPKRSAVALTFERRRIDGSLFRFKREVERERIEEGAAVPAALMLSDGTGYIRVTSFADERAAEDLHRALADLEKAGMQRLLLDLRDNGGGLVDEAARIAGEFLPKGAVVYTTEGRKPEIASTERVGRSFWRQERRYPVVVLVNEGTASASELVAGALQDHDRALIVGRRTFGKSLLMQGFPLADGSVVMLVVGHLKTPCGRVIQRQYRDVTRREYYRMSRAQRETADRPTCTTAGGRTVYGGGGIYPDVLLPEREPAPLWLARATEEDLPLRWVGGYLTAHEDDFSTPDALAAQPSLPASALQEFRRFAAAQGVPIPDGAKADALLERTLLRGIALARWGETGWVRVDVALDPEIAAAAEQFREAATILGGAQ